MSAQTRGQTDDEFGKKGRVEIIMKEYSTLRDEIIGRSAHLVQVLSIGIAALALLFTQPLNIKIVLISLLISSLFLLCFSVAIGEISRQAERVRAIEKYVNEQVGEKLLVWEQDLGGDVTEYKSWYPYAKRIFFGMKKRTP